MAYPSNLLRLVLGGGLYANTEQWTFSLHLAYGVPDAQPPVVVPTAIVDAATAYIQTNDMLSNAVSLQWIKLNEIGPDGRYTQDDTVMHEFDPPIAGDLALANIAPQTALAITLRTSAARGRAARGRYYLPMPGYQLGALGLLAPGDQAFYANAATAFLNALNASMPSLGARVVVASDVGGGAVRVVERVAVGAAFDTIRSRRRSMTERYVEGAALAD